jgi:hypothetical protein
VAGCGLLSPGSRRLPAARRRAAVSLWSGGHGAMLARRPLLSWRKQALLQRCSGPSRPPLSSVGVLTGSQEADGASPVVRRRREGRARL